MEKNVFLSKLVPLNFSLSLLIVLLHSSCENLLIEGYGYENFQLFFRGIGIIADAATPTFFFISSYLFFKNFTINDYKIKIKKRFYSLVLPFFLWSSIYFIVFAILQNLPFTPRINQTPIEGNVKFILKALFNNEYNAPLWYLKTLFIYVLINPIIFILVRNTNKYSFILVLASLVSNYMYGFQYTSVFFWAPAYLLGACCSIVYDKCFDESFIKKNRKVYLTIFSLVFCSIIPLFIVAVNDLTKRGLAYYSLRMLSVIFIVLIIILFIPIIKERKIYKTSFFIFCSHSLIVLFIRKIASIFLNNNNFHVMLCYLITFIGTIIIIETIYKLLDRYMPKFLLVLCGGRK